MFRYVTSGKFVFQKLILRQKWRLFKLDESWLERSRTSDFTTTTYLQELYRSFIYFHFLNHHYKLVQGILFSTSFRHIFFLSVFIKHHHHFFDIHFMFPLPLFFFELCIYHREEQKSFLQGDINIDKFGE